MNPNLRAECTRVDVMRHHQEQRFVDIFLVHFLQHRELFLGSKVLRTSLSSLSISGRNSDPIGAGRRFQIALQMPDKTVKDPG